MHRKLWYHWTVFSFSLERNTGKLALVTFTIFALLAILGGVSTRQCLVVGIGIECIRSFVRTLRKTEGQRTVNPGFILAMNSVLMTSYLLLWWYIMEWSLFPLTAWIVRTLTAVVGFSTAASIHVGYSLNRKRFEWIEDFFVLSQD